MASEVKTNKISPSTGVTVTLGDASDVFQLPASAEIDIASGATLDVNGTIDVTGATVTGLTTGKVLQLLEDNITTNVSTTSTSYVASGLTITITPASTSSKFLLTLSGGCTTVDDVEQIILTTFYVDGAEVAETGPYSRYRESRTGKATDSPHSAACLHSPATVSAVTYTVYYKASANTTYFNWSSDRTVFTVMELSS